MGAVYEAYDPRLRRRLAIKVLKSSRRAGESSDMEDKLREEARALGRLSHPSVVTVTDVGVHAGQTFVAMEFVDGGTLADWTTARPLGMRGRTRQLVQFAIEAAEGLHAAHEAGLTHRDVKPANLLIDARGRLRLADFGLAAASPSTGSAAAPAHSGTYRRPVGTPAFMAPEQFAGEADERSDQFGWALSFYEALCGVRPFAANSIHARLDKFSRGPWPLAEVPPGLPARVGQVLVRALKIDPEDRYPSMEAAAEALRGATTRPGRWALGAGLVLCSGAVIALVSRASVPECDPMQLRDNWSSARSAELRGSLEQAAPFGAQTWTTIEPQLDTLADEWTRVRIEVCTDARSGAIGSDAAARSLVCLQTAQDARDEAIDALLDADLETVGRARKIIDELPSAQGCEPAELGLELASADTDPRLVQAAVALAAGKHEAAAQKIERILADARAKGDRVNEARALSQRAVLYIQREQPEQAIDDLRAAFFTASALGEDALAFSSALQLAFVYGEKTRNVPEANAWIEHAEVAAARKGLEPIDTARLEARRGVIAQRDGRLESAAAHARRSIELMTSELGPDARAVASGYVNLSNALREQEDFEGAAQSLQAALESHARRLGSKHPETVSVVRAICELRGVSHRPETALQACGEYVAFARESYPPGHLQLGLALAADALARSRQGQLDAASQGYRASLEILEAHYPATHPRVAQTQQNLAIVLLELDELDEAIPLFHRGLESTRAVLGRDHLDVGVAMVNLAGAYVEADEPEAAARLLREALGILSAKLGPRTRARVIASGMLIRIQLDEGRSDEAMELLEPIVAGLKESPLDGETDGWIHMLYSRALLAKGDRGGAVQHAALARSLLAAGAESAPSIREELDALTKLLADGG